MKKIYSLACMLAVSMLFVIGAYGEANPDPTFDIVPFVMDVGPLVDVTAITDDNIENLSYPYTFETSSEPTVMDSAFMRFSKPVDAVSIVSYIESRRIYKVPWQ